ncbi:hypothetical protein [Nostoc sp.]|uniref:hypothetical protein n=1 Tax=Nostoc sp. TaxID=1180 RepID=UPI002FF64446
MHQGKFLFLSGSDLERLKQQLQEPSGFQSYGQIQQWLKSTLTKSPVQRIGKRYTPCEYTLI